MLTKYQKYQIMRWTDLVEGLLFVLVIHELFLRSRVKSGPLGQMDISHPLPQTLRIIGGTGLLPETVVKIIIMTLMVTLIVVTHIKNDKVAPSNAASCGTHNNMYHGSHAMSHPKKKRMVTSFNPRSDAQGRPDANQMIME